VTRLAVLLALPVAGWIVGELLVGAHFSLCAFQRLTGRPCPGCGMTRAMVDLAHLDFAGSLRMHPLGVVLAAGYLAAVVGTAVGIVRGGDPVADFLERRGGTITTVLLTAFITLWILRAFVVTSWAPDPIVSPAGLR
jgi:hypothetical protein